MVIQILVLYIETFVRVSSLSFTEKWLIDFSEKEVDALSQSHDLCIGGDCIEMLQQTSAVLQVVPYVKVISASFY